jgi:hypothetical protein
MVWSAPKWGIKWTLVRIKSTDMIDTLRRLFRTSLDTLYMRCLGSGVAGMRVNHSTYARWVGGDLSGEGNHQQTMFHVSSSGQCYREGQRTKVVTVWSLCAQVCIGLGVIYIALHSIPQCFTDVLITCRDKTLVNGMSCPQSRQCYTDGHSLIPMCTGLYGIGGDLYSSSQHPTMLHRCAHNL